MFAIIGTSDQSGWLAEACRTLHLLVMQTARQQLAESLLHKPITRAPTPTPVTPVTPDVTPEVGRYFLLHSCTICCSPAASFPLQESSPLEASSTSSR